VILAAALVLSVLAQGAPSAAPLSPLGVWKTPVDEGLIRIEHCGGAICGYVAGSARLNSQPNQIDIRNPDQTLRSRPVMGLLMMKLNPEGPGRWGGGWVYSPKDGGTYKAKLEVVSEGRLRLTGCLAPLLCQTQTWTKVG
jgi:uncharacterized protein (DUF2147 family)